MCAELLLERMSPQEINCVDGGGRTVVHASAYNNSVECLSLLLRRGPEVSVVDNQGMTPLMMAAKHGHTNVVGEWCALCGVVCLKGVTTPLDTPPDLLTCNWSDEQLRLEHQDLKKNTALHLACLQTHEECALAILDKSSDLIIQLTNSVDKTYVGAV